MNREELEEFIHNKKDVQTPLKKNHKTSIDKFAQILRGVSDEIIYLKQQGLTFDDMLEFLDIKRNIKIPKKVLIYFYKKHILKKTRHTIESIIKDSDSIKYKLDKFMENYKGKRINIKGLIYKISNYSISNSKLHLGLSSSDKTNFEVMEFDPKDGDIKERLEKLMVKE